MTRRGPDRTNRHPQQRTCGLVPGGVAVHQLVAVEVVLGVAALVPALQEVGVERHEQAAARIVVLQREHVFRLLVELAADRKSTRLNSSHGYISYAVFCLKKKKSEQAV